MEKKLKIACFFDVPSSLGMCLVFHLYHRVAYDIPQVFAAVHSPTPRCTRTGFDGTRHIYYFGDEGTIQGCGCKANNIILFLTGAADCCGCPFMA